MQRHGGQRWAVQGLLRLRFVLQSGRDTLPASQQAKEEDPGSSAVTSRASQPLSRAETGGLGLRAFLEAIVQKLSGEKVFLQGPVPTSFSCPRPVRGRQSVCLFIFKVKLTSVSCSRWFLF